MARNHNSLQPRICLPNCFEIEGDSLVGVQEQQAVRRHGVIDAGKGRGNVANVLVGQRQRREEPSVPPAQSAPPGLSSELLNSAKIWPAESSCTAAFPPLGMKTPSTKGNPSTRWYFPSPAGRQLSFGELDDLAVGRVDASIASAGIPVAAGHDVDQIEYLHGSLGHLTHKARPVQRRKAQALRCDSPPRPSTRAV